MFDLDSLSNYFSTTQMKEYLILILLADCFRPLKKSKIPLIKDFGSRHLFSFEQNKPILFFKICKLLSMYFGTELSAG